MRKFVVTVVVGTAVATGGASAAMGTVAAASASTGAEAHAARGCGSVGGRGRRWQVTIDSGRVTCGTARKILRAFLHGKGRMHGPRNGPAADQYWTLYGWKCGNGAGAVGCNRHHFRDYIYAES